MKKIIVSIFATFVIFNTQANAGGILDRALSVGTDAVEQTLLNKNALENRKNRYNTRYAHQKEAAELASYCRHQQQQIRSQYSGREEDYELYKLNKFCQQKEIAERKRFRQRTNETYYENQQRTTKTRLKIDAIRSIGNAARGN